jgi:hypothetical protein
VCLEVKYSQATEKDIAMTVTLAHPTFNNRLADVYAQTRGIDKTLKFGSSLAGLTSNILSYSTGEISQLSGKTIGSLGKSLSSIRSGVKVFDVLQDFSTPTGDVHEKKMKWIQLVCFASADILNPIFFFESQGFYSICEKTKELMGKVATSFGLTGVVTSLVNTGYQLSKASEQLLKVEQAILNEDNRVSQLATIKETHSQLLAQLEELRQKLPTSEVSEGSAEDQLQVNEEEVRAIESQIADLSGQIENAQADIRRAETLLVGKEVALEKVLKNELTIVEKIMDIAAIVFSFAAGVVSASVFVPVMATLGLISASIALAKIWRETGFSNAVNDQLRQALIIAAQ